MQQDRDEQLWRIAQRRARFRRSLYSYIVINSFLWLVWWFTMGRYNGFKGYPWPVWVMLGWGIVLAMQYFQAYNGNRQDLAEEEYEKLRRKKDGYNN